MARSQMVEAFSVVRPTVGGTRTADGTRRSTVGTLNMGTWAGTGEALALDIASDVPSTFPGHRTNSGVHGEAYSTHTYAFQRSCTYDSLVQHAEYPILGRICLSSPEIAGYGMPGVQVPVWSCRPK